MDWGASQVRRVVVLGRGAGWFEKTWWEGYEKDDEVWQRWTIWKVDCENGRYTVGGNGML